MMRDKKNIITLVVGGLRAGGAERNIRYLIDYFVGDYQIIVYTLSNPHTAFYKFPENNLSLWST